MKTLLLGKRGEAFAAEYLRKKGYEITDANFRSRFGEIDLIAKRRSEILFVEVKTRKSSSFMNAFEAVDARKQERLRLTAEVWIAKNDPKSKYSTRFDVIEVYLNEFDAPASVKHIENAFGVSGYSER